MMLFQTYYRLDPWAFEPPIESFRPIQFDFPQERFALLMNYQGAADESEEPVLRIQTLHRRDDLPPEVEGVFTGEATIDWKIGEGEHDGLDPFPGSYREFVLNLHAHIDQLATNVFNVVRWRMGISGGPLVLSSVWEAMRWHDPSKGELSHGYLNRQIPAGSFTVELPEMQHVALDTECRKSVDLLLQFQSRQPLYHDLFREAWQNKKANGRSAIVMGVAAGETGFKMTAGDLSPAVSWILENIPSPPLVLMIREYLEKLPARKTFKGRVLRPPKKLIAKVQKGIELRNNLVHGRVEDVDPEELTEILIAIRDLLYLMDFYRGHEWALDRMTPEVRRELEATEAT